MRLSLQPAEHPFRQLAHVMNQMMDQMAKRDFYQFSSRDEWEPPVNLYETPSGYLLCMELAGMKPDQIDVHAEARRVVVHGERSHPRLDQSTTSVSVHLMEISSGSFRREIALPSDVQDHRIQATYRDGYLWLVMPRAPHESKKQ